MKKRIYVEIQNNFVVGVHSNDFDQSQLEYVVVDRDLETDDQQAAEDCAFFDNLPENPNSLYQANAEDERI